MTSLLNKTLLMAFFLGMAFFANASLIFIDKDATGVNDGTSWTDAFTEIQVALDFSVAGDVLWVANGVYFPPTISGFRFQKDDISFYGGFLGTETLLSERDHEANPVILSGNIGAINTNTDNAYQVIDINHVDNIFIDGVIVQDGNANSTFNSSSQSGGGAFVEGEATFQNCWFRDNYALAYGGAINVATQFGSTGDLDLYNCIFTNNHSDFTGGAVSYFCTTKNCNTVGCLFQNNTQGDSPITGGGAVSSPTTTLFGYELIFESCRFIGNHSNAHGGAFYLLNDTQLNNCFIANNSSESSGAWLYTDPNIGSTISMSNCTVVNNTSEEPTGSGFASNLNTINPYSVNVFNSIFWNPDLDDEFLLINGTSFAFSNNILKTPVDFTNTSGTVLTQENFSIYPQFTDPISGDFHFDAQSPATNRGNNTFVFSPTDLDGDQRIRLGTVDLGCYEVQACAAPTNDICEGAIELTGDGSCMFGSTLCAGGQEDLTITCNNGGEGHSVWYKYTSETGGDIDLSVDDLEGFEQTFDLILSVFQNGCSSLANMFCVDNYDPTQTEPAQIPSPNPGDTYYFRVEGQGQDDGVFDICLTEGVAPGCPGDFNVDYTINSADLLIFLGAFGCSNNCAIDLNSDGNTNSADLLVFLALFGQDC